MHMAVLAEGSDEDFVETITTFHDSLHDPQDLSKYKSKTHVSKKYVNNYMKDINHCKHYLRIRFKKLLNKVDEDHKTALHVAMEREKYARVLTLLKYKAGKQFILVL